MARSRHLAPGIPGPQSPSAESQATAACQPTDNGSSRPWFAYAIAIAATAMAATVGGAMRVGTRARRAAASEERFRLLMDHTPALAWVKDEQGRYTYLNKAYQQRFGRTLSECRGKTDVDLWPPEVAARLQEADRAALAAGHPIEITEETTEANGSVSFWLNTKFPFRDAAGRQFVASLGLDITDRKRFQEAVQDSETRLRLAVETAGLGMYERDLVTNQVTLNSTGQSILGVSEPYPPDFPRGTLHPEDRERVLEAVARAYDPALREICAAEFRIVRPDNTIRWVAGRGRVLFDDEAQPPRPIKFIGVLNDITERRRYEESLRRSQASLTQAVRVARLGIFEHDHLSNSVVVSSELREIYGFGAEETVTLAAILERIPTHLREEALELIRRAHDPTGDGTFESEHPLLAPGREPRWMSVRSQTFFEGEGQQRRAVRTIGAVLDITEQKQHADALSRLVQERTAKLEETVAELEHFSYTITHDMRAPLRAINGYTNILTTAHAGSLPESGRDLLRRVSESALRMDQLITDALQYGKAVRQDLQLQPLDAAAAIRGVVEAYPQFQQPHARITVQPKMPRLMANGAAFTQVISNLLGNAVKFVSPGTIPLISVSAEARGEMVRLWVEDNGIGIAPEYHDKIWHMFQRLSKDYEGTGIGLALVRKVVERMGGRVGLESALGQGSRFWVELRRAD